MSKIFTVWKDKQYVGMTTKQVAIIPLIHHMTGKRAHESDISRVLSGEKDNVVGCVVVAHHHNDSLPFTEKDVERVKAEGWKFINDEANAEA